MEMGTAVPTVEEAEAWAKAVSASDAEREALVRLTRRANLETSSWAGAMSGKQHLQGDVAADEAAATAVLEYQTSVIPGLLQVPDYARRVFEMFAPVEYSEDALAAAIAARMQRQQILYDTSRQFSFLLTETALRWRPGPPSLLRAQLIHLRSLSMLPNVSLGLIPLDGEASTTYSHSFIIRSSETADGADSVVSLELSHGPLTLDRAENVQIYRQRWSSLQDMAMFGDDARDYLDTLITNPRATAAEGAKS